MYENKGKCFQTGENRKSGDTGCSFYQNFTSSKSQVREVNDLVMGFFHIDIYRYCGFYINAW